ncbi:pilus assembly protein N-terminal domain-containing protein [Tianweitania sp. BSSL-BM11]|uniref:Pilus assembly protein N-terminal domain-containing protein n=1 Tax=Tianweitania aestuarii TaxID=2814886 RepID=A0ABS5RQG1_9HYPH|nr:pilus assembly protein N-terminal domain-containing protein [Tianweitania aestuarii]MBS9719246.1 pilus assembly protein N-terminal domain-containing protein [Tianweitania aestuarii]
MSLLQVTRSLTPLLLGGLLGFALMGPASAETGVQVMMNEAKIIKVARPIDTVVIGNSAIVDAAVQNNTTIVLTGKGFGSTNVVLLDKDGQAIVDQQVTVSRQDSGSVRVYRRAQMQTLSCTPYCEGAYRNEAEQKSEEALNGGR